MKVPIRIMIILLVVLWLHGLSTTYHLLQAKDKIFPEFVPDTMPNAIRIRLDNIQLCNERNNHRSDINQLICNENNPQLDPTTYSMDEYVLGVLKAEAGPSAAVTVWHPEALKAQTVIMRTYGWGHVQDRGDGTYEIGSSDSAQTFFPEKPVDEQLYSNAVNTTSGQYLSHPDGDGAADVINTQYRTRNGDPTNPCPLGQGTNCPIPPDPCPGLFLSYFMDAYLKGVPDPISNGETRSQIDCNSAGLGQVGTQRLAIGNSDPTADPASPNFPSLNYLQILTHYYTSVHIKNANSSNVSLTPSRRWAPLIVNWGGNSSPPPMQPGLPSPVTIRLQNTGINAFAANYRLSCQWRKPDNSIVNCLGSDIANPDTLNTGATNTVNLNVTPLSDFAAGTYTLMIDMKVGSQFFHDWEAPNRPWFTLDYPVLVDPGICPQDDSCGGGTTLYLPVVFRSNAPPPSSCTWTIDNLLDDGGFNNLPQAYWQEINVFDTDPNQKPLSTLRTQENSLPGNSPWSAKLGGRDDPFNLNFEHAVFQGVRLNTGGFPANVEEVAIEFSYYLTTSDSPHGDFDNFFVDLKVNGLGPTNSILPGQVIFSNRFPYQDEWRRRGPDDDGIFQVGNMQQYAGDAVYLIFYSDVDGSYPTAFYLDAVKLKGCTD